MKNIVFMTLGVALFCSCTKKKVDKLEEQMTDGTWVISKFVEDGEDETTHYSGYTFVFGEDGSLKATKGSTTTSGTWSIKDDKSNDDSSTDFDFIISLPVVDKLDDLNDDWDVLKQEDALIELKDVSGGNGGTDYLTFVKK